MTWVYNYTFFLSHIYIIIYKKSCFYKIKLINYDMLSLYMVLVIEFIPFFFWGV